MIVFKEVETLTKYISKIDKTHTIGFVPTMGALHKGHLSLIKRANDENDFTVVSIFVNPTQFDKAEDLNKYPRTLNTDLDLLEKVDCNIVFVPSVQEVYPVNATSEIFNFAGLDKYMEGLFREGHFDGVGTVVKRLLEIVKPDNAYFGEKDYQQLLIIKKMVETEKLPVNIIGCDIYREPDGLAMSSRNIRLSKEQRKEAPQIFKTLNEAKEMFKNSSISEVKAYVEQVFQKNKLLELEYFEIADASSLKPVTTKKPGEKYRGFIAVFAGKIRLIDNIALN
ncbi:MAG: pantoate--beta-alanine ligase [Flavobacteriia bacterium]|nr:MAG: pantoate--beta-alanine ligase [Flavobacteriia bacterium]